MERNVLINEDRCHITRVLIDDVASELDPLRVIQNIVCV